jgi:hypothetical protein
MQPFLRAPRQTSARPRAAVNIQLLSHSPQSVLLRHLGEEQFGWRVAESCPKSVRILDTIDLHCLRLARQQAFKEKRAFSSLEIEQKTRAKQAGENQYQEPDK